ncbi:MAG: LLM class F420-dependent oxidoreductase [Acidimicrobiia bacterium]|nr:LLM class F420-dependent oxidoreductase [Acidimicrobiia bacterium]
MSLRLGIVTPVLTRLPGAHAQWEETAGLAEIERVVVKAEGLGYDFCTCSEHVAVPADIAEVRGGTYWDPLAIFGYLAARTTTIKLATFVLVLGYHHPLAIAKRYGTLDVVSDGRLVLGVGSGSLEEEFELLGSHFADRGARADDAMRALRAALSESRPSYHGEFYDFDDFLVEPHAVQRHVPMWVGGRTARSLRRAVELGDGWAPFGLRTAELDELLTRARDRDAWAERDTPIEVVLQNDRPWDPLGEPERVADQLGRMHAIGATGLAVRLVHHSVDHYCDQLGALAALTTIRKP